MPNDLPKPHDCEITLTSEQVDRYFDGDEIDEINELLEFAKKQDRPITVLLTIEPESGGEEEKSPEDIEGTE
jgi:hypothetical protein